MVPGKRYSVFSIRSTKKHGTIWVRAGVAFVNADDSMNLYLDVLPLEGQLHVRETGEKRSTTDLPARSDEAPRADAAPPVMGGH